MLRDIIVSDKRNKLSNEIVQRFKFTHDLTFTLLNELLNCGKPKKDNQLLIMLLPYVQNTVPYLSLSLL